MKKTLSCLLCALLLLPLFAQAEETEGPETLVSGDYKYILLEDGTAEITGYSGDAESLAVPAEIDGHSVTGIGKEAFYRYAGLIKIALPDSVTGIGDRAFYGCKNLESITIPEGVTAIGDEAFVMCSGLNGITIPKGVTSIG